MKYLFVHNNFPAQFRHIAQDLACDPNNSVAAIAAYHTHEIPGVRLERYLLSRQDLSATHPFARSFDIECRRAEQVLYSACRLKAAGFTPDTIVVHSGWGENMPLREVFPDARLVVYCEFFYRPDGQDVDFDPEFAYLTVDGRMTLRGRNANALLALVDADDGISPTRWQRSTYPKPLQEKIAVVHEGVDTTDLAPNAEACLSLPSGRVLTKRDQIVTFVARNLEPLRGYHIFMRALPRIMKACPHAEIIVVGGDGVSYGVRPPPGTTWKAKYLSDVAGQIDLSRLHFLGHLPYNSYRKVLQVSSAHVYFTYPFVLSWSLVEAMSVGCTIVASDTGPVQDVLDEQSAILVPFFDAFGLADAVIECIGDQERHRHLGETARKIALEDYDLVRTTLPKWKAFLSGQRRN